MKDVRKQQKVVVSALEDIKARDIQVFDVTHMTAMFDRVIVASADSGRQLRAISRNVQDKSKAAGMLVFGVEGEDGAEWVLVDLGDIVVHIMQPTVRQHYNLEELWNHPAPAKPRATRKAATAPATESDSVAAPKAPKKAAARPPAKAARKTAKKTARTQT